MRVDASATVDVIDAPPSNGGGLGVFKVRVWGVDPHNYVRIYEIKAQDDNMAAREGLDRFVAEFTKDQ